MKQAYRKSAQLYDLFCRHKDYRQASNSLKQLIHEQAPNARSLLDVACGTGGHLQFLGEDFNAEGIDLSPEMLDIAREKCPGLIFHQGDLLEFDLGRQFDVVMCMFGSIGYSGTVARMNDAIMRLTRHVRTGGLLIVEPWLTPEAYVPGKITADFIDEPDLKAARMYHHKLEDSRSVFDIEYLVCDSSGVQRYSEKHSLGLFSTTEYVEAMKLAGLEVSGEGSDLFGYGLLVGNRQNCSSGPEQPL
jgi:ubiquinone/menaquinone biosynthesis C-methylase UbiE